VRAPARVAVEPFDLPAAAFDGSARRRRHGGAAAARYEQAIGCQVSGIRGESPRAVRLALDEQLRSSGLENCHIVSVDLDVPYAGAARVGRFMGVKEPGGQREPSAGGLLLVAAAAWAVWFFWWMLSATPD
jgi:hypothetical protein